MRIGHVDWHVPRGSMTDEAVALWDRAVADVKLAGADVVAFDPPVTLWNYRDHFADLARARGDVRLTHAPRRHRRGAAPLLHRPHRRPPRRRAPRLPGLPELLRRPPRHLGGMRAAPRHLAHRRPGRPLLRPLPRRGDPLGYGNWLGLPEVSVPAGYGADGMPGMNLSVVGLPGDDARVLALAHAYEAQSRRFRAPVSR
ncbi:MAG: hypothetical protein IPK12_24850 [Gemmatimonadetes bacterium]|nr:hypothetical protein [Gemmatimonadota bacterium]